MRFVFNMIYLAALVSLPVAAHAQPVDTSRPNSSYFLGAWDCTGMVFASEGKDVKNVVGTWRFHHWPSGWVTDAFETYTGKGGAFAEWGWTRYDHREHAYVRHAANTLGGHAHYQTDGWSDDTWVWSGQAQALTSQRAPVVQTITKKSDDYFWISVRYFDHHNKRQDLYKADCRRQSSHAAFEQSDLD